MIFFVSDPDVSRHIYCPFLQELLIQNFMHLKTNETQHYIFRTL